MVYMEGKQPVKSMSFGTEEPDLEEKPIKIIAASSSEELDPASRVNFSKTNTIGHMTKVHNVGQVHPDFVNTLRLYYLQECGCLTSDSAQSSMSTVSGGQTSSFERSGPEPNSQSGFRSKFGHGYKLDSGYKPEL